MLLGEKNQKEPVSPVRLEAVPTPVDPPSYGFVQSTVTRKRFPFRHRTAPPAMHFGAWLIVIV
jgi:hypothetical protein